MRRLDQSEEARIESENHSLEGLRVSLDKIDKTHFTVQELMDSVPYPTNYFSLMRCIHYLERRGIIIFSGYGENFRGNQYRKSY